MPAPRVVILAGGLGTRLGEETITKPKPMVEIGGYPILWHIMGLYARFGLTDFIVCAGYQGQAIRQYFERQPSARTPWQVTVADTGEHTGTGGRLRRIRHLLNGEDFCMTYGDGLANIDIAALLARHARERRLATVAAVHPPARFGVLDLAGNRVVSFEEKPQTATGWINGGFFALKNEVLNRIPDDASSFEHGCLPALARQGQLTAWHHEGFWHPMDTPRDVRQLQQLWDSGRAPWELQLATAAAR